MEKHSRRNVEVAEWLADGGAGWWRRLWYRVTTGPGNGNTLTGTTFLMVFRWPQLKIVDVLDALFTISLLEGEGSKTGQCNLLRCTFGNPFSPVTLDPAWRTPAVVQLARSLYEERRFEDMPVLADALEEAGCQDATVLEHCRGPGPHVRGCWVLDLLLGKE
jgi:hypothetical protein